MRRQAVVASARLEGRTLALPSGRKQARRRVGRHACIRRIAEAPLSLDRMANTEVGPSPAAGSGTLGSRRSRAAAQIVPDPGDRCVAFAIVRLAPAREGRRSSVPPAHREGAPSERSRAQSREWGIPLAPPDMPDERLDVVPDHCLRTSARAEKHAWPLAVPITGWVAAPAAGLNAAAGEVVVLRGYPTWAKPSARGHLSSLLHPAQSASGCRRPMTSANMRRRHRPRSR